MRIEKLQSKTEWEAFLKAQKFSLFTQSGAYADFQNKLGDESEIFVIHDGAGKMCGGFLVITVHARRGSYLFVPYGPVFDETITGEERKKIFEAVSRHMKDYAQKKKLVCVRMSPFWDDTPETRGLFTSLGYKNAPLHALAEHTWILDIQKSPDELFSVMNKNHRNLIRRCEKEGVQISIRTDDQATNELSRLHDETARRHGFVRFSKEYIETEYRALLADGSAAVFEARLPDGRLDSAAVIIFYGSMACYRHSASLGLDKRLPTSYLLQWRVIEEAQKRGMRLYNFWGIAPEGAGKTHPFFGITHFKTGFGGNAKKVIHCQDLPTSWRYYPMRVLELLRKYKRGF